MQFVAHDGVGQLLRRLLIGLTGLMALATLSACNSRGGPVPYDPTNFGPPDTPGVVAANTPQRIGPLDKLKINVFQVETLSGEFQVDSAGKIDFPLIGSVPAQGRTTVELADMIGAKLGERYLKSPNVQVAITDAAEQTITVDGSVKDPGQFPIKGTTTLMRAVALAKGASEDANIARVVVFRTVNGERVAGAFDLRSIRRAEMADPVIYGNDIVIVDGNRARTIYRDLLGSINLLGILRPY